MRRCRWRRKPPPDPPAGGSGTRPGTQAHPVCPAEAVCAVPYRCAGSPTADFQQGSTAVPVLGTDDYIETMAKGVAEELAGYDRAETFTCCGEPGRIASHGPFLPRE